MDIYKKTFVDSESTSPVKITKYHTMAYYPYLLFECEVELENNEKVYCNFNIHFDAEKSGIPIYYQKDMEYWIYSIPLENVTDESSYVYLNDEISRKILKQGLTLWNDSLRWQESWTTLKN